MTAVIQEAWIAGASTCRVEDLVQAMGMSGISKAQVSKLCKDIDGRVSSFLETPWYGSRQMARCLRRQGYTIGRKRVRRLMAKMGLAAIYQAPRTTIPHPEHRIYKYLLRDMVVDRPKQVWCADITYNPMRRGFLYPIPVMASTTVAYAMII